MPHRVQQPAHGIDPSHRAPRHGGALPTGARRSPDGSLVGLLLLRMDRSRERMSPAQHHLRQRVAEQRHVAIGVARRRRHKRVIGARSPTQRWRAALRGGEPSLQQRLVAAQGRVGPHQRRVGTHHRPAGVIGRRSSKHERLEASDVAVAAGEALAELWAGLDVAVKLGGRACGRHGRLGKRLAGIQPDDAATRMRHDELGGLPANHNPRASQVHVWLVPRGIPPQLERVAPVDAHVDVDVARRAGGRNARHVCV